MISRHWFFQLITCLLILGSCFDQQALGCSQALPATPREIVDRSVAVFRGGLISAELVDLGNIGTEEYIPLVKVRWRLEEVYKGQNLGDGFAVTQYFCGGVFPIVGQPYIFALGPVDEDQSTAGVLSGIKGYLDDQGTKGEWKEADEFGFLVAEFQKLRDGR